MRIIGGTAKGRRLLTAKGLAIRPTQDRVKESLFNIIGEAMIGAEVLDLFAGAGSIGLEALSRGASHAVFVEKNAHHVKVLRKNLSNCGFSQAAEIYCRDALKVLGPLSRAAKKFDFIFADPPYGNSDLALETLKRLDSSKLLAKNGLVVIEHSKRVALPEALSQLGLFRQKQFGDTVLSFYKEPLKEGA